MIVYEYINLLLLIQGFHVLPKYAHQIWADLPEKVDVLVTHMPPFGILDEVSREKLGVGSKLLRKAVEKMKPKIHIFGHIHESHSHKKIEATDFYNVPMLD